MGAKSVKIQDATTLVILIYGHPGNAPLNYAKPKQNESSNCDKNTINKLTKVYIFYMIKIMQKQLDIKKIKIAMGTLGLNQAGLAKKMNVSRTIVSTWFKGEKYPRPDKLLNLGLVLGLPFNDLVGKTTELEPVVSFRKKGNRKTKNIHIDRAKDMGRLLELLVPFISFDGLVQPPVLKNPILEYQYIQKAAAKIRKDIKASSTGKIKFEQLIKKFNELEAVIIPVLWGSRENHENALHLFLPSSKTTWIYLNLDSNIHDFKFWMAHELGHVISPELEGDFSEDFADTFAQALLFPEKMAENVYKKIKKLRSNKTRINHILDLATEYTISPITILESVNAYIDAYDLDAFNLGKGFYGATTNFNKKYPTVSSKLNDGKEYTAEDYIRISRKLFKTPFFDMLRMFLSENDKSPGFIQGLLETRLLDAKQIHAELVK